MEVYFTHSKNRKPVRNKKHKNSIACTERIKDLKNEWIDKEVRKERMSTIDYACNLGLQCKFFEFHIISNFTV